jgi:hypothetical protein
LSQLNDQELLVITNNAERLAQRVNPNVGPDAEVINLGTKEKVSPEGIMQLKEQAGQVSPPGTMMGNIESKINKLKASVKEMDTGANMDTIMADALKSQQGFKKLQDQGLVTAATREILQRDIKAGKIKLPKEIEDRIMLVEGNPGRVDPIQIFREQYGEDALEQVDSLVPDLAKAKSYKDLLNIVDNKYTIKPRSSTIPQTINIDDAKKAEKEFNIIPADSEEGKMITEKLIGKPKASVTELVTAEKIILDMKKMDPMDAMKEANKVLKKEGKYKNLQEKDVKRIMDDTNDFIFGRDIPEDPEGFAAGGRVGMAKGGPTLNTDSQGRLINSITGVPLKDNLRPLSIETTPSSTLRDKLRPLSLEDRRQFFISNKPSYDDFYAMLISNLDDREQAAKGGSMSKGLDYLMGIERRGYADGDYVVQAGVKNYLGEQETATVPIKWKSGEGDKHPDTELAYITKPEKELLIKLDMHGSMKDGKPNFGPAGLISLNSGGSGDGGDGGGGGGGGGDDGDSGSSSSSGSSGDASSPGDTGGAGGDDGAGGNDAGGSSSSSGSDSTDTGDMGSEAANDAAGGNGSSGNSGDGGDGGDGGNGITSTSLLDNLIVSSNILNSYKAPENRDYRLFQSSNNPFYSLQANPTLSSNLLYSSSTPENENRSYKLFQSSNNPFYSLQANPSGGINNIFTGFKTGGRVGFAEGGSQGLDYLMGIERRGYADGTANMLSRTEFFNNSDSWKEWEKVMAKLDEAVYSGYYSMPDKAAYIKNLDETRRKLYAQTWDDYYKYEAENTPSVNTIAQTTPETPTEDFSDYLNTSSVNTIAQTTPETPTEDFSDYLNTPTVEEQIMSPDDSMNQDIDATNAGVPDSNLFQKGLTALTPAAQLAKGILGIGGTPITQSMETSLQDIIQNQIKETGGSTCTYFR